jgi:hypothetical protein
VYYINNSCTIDPVSIVYIDCSKAGHPLLKTELCDYSYPSVLLYSLWASSAFSGLSFWDLPMYILDSGGLVMYNY